MLLLISSCLGDDDDGFVPPPNQITTLIVTDEAKFPEGLAYDASSNTVFTGASTDGTIYSGEMDAMRMQVRNLTGADIAAALGMEVAGDSLFVAGGSSEKAYIVSLNDNTVRELSKDAVPAGDSTFINDVVVAQDGTAYFTDSYYPAMYRYTGGDSLETWIDLDSIGLEYGAGFNLNGIVLTPDDRYLLTVQTNTGRLFRVDTQDKSVVQVNIGDNRITNGDGMDLVGNILYVARNREDQLVIFTMSADYAIGQLATIVTGDFRFPSAVAATSDSLLIMNAQLDKQGGTPQLPFTISKFAR
jgi:Cu-Zn family superoxide dismutase